MKWVLVVIGALMACIGTMVWIIAAGESAFGPSARSGFRIVSGEKWREYNRDATDRTRGPKTAGCLAALVGVIILVIGIVKFLK